MAVKSRKMVRRKAGKKSMNMMVLKGHGHKFGLHFVGNGYSLKHFKQGGNMIIFTLQKIILVAS